jgi:4-cresol dehydrogenase (hydroxylating)
MFVQSNFGIVTKANFWLMPEPEVSYHALLNLPDMEDIRWAMDVFADLRLRGVIDHNVVFGNYLHDASISTTRAEWYDKPGPIPDDIARKIQAKFNVGWWTCHISVYGDEGVAQAKKALIDAAFRGKLREAIPWKSLRKGEPRDPFAVAAGVPFVLPLNVTNWLGGRGGHIGFSPVMPPSGKLAWEAFLSRKRRFEAENLDYYSSFTVGHRHIANVNMILYNRDDAAMVAGARRAFLAMMADAKAEGYGEYRTHIDFMGDVAKTYDFGGGALMKLNERIKDTLDPNGILAPGKNGVWPGRLRAHASDKGGEA